MKLSAAFSVLLDLRFALQNALLPTFLAVLRAPYLLFNKDAISRLFMAKLWVTFGDGVDGNGKPVKEHLITPNAYGVVLDIGAGHGHTARYLDRTRVTKYIALEPNVHMHTGLRSVANAAGFTEADGSLLILSCGAEDIESIRSSMNEDLDRHQPPVDTLISILSLCTIPSPEQTLFRLVRDVLKPGGQFLFYEHVLSDRSDVAWWQKFWAPVWQIAFDGCRLDRPTHRWVERMPFEEGADEGSMWGESKMWGKEGEPEEDLFFHRVGKFNKVSA